MQPISKVTVCHKAERALDILFESQSVANCKKRHIQLNSSIIFALKSRSLPDLSALLQAAQPALVYEWGKKLLL